MLVERGRWNPTSILDESIYTPSFFILSLIISRDLCFMYLISLQSSLSCLKSSDQMFLICWTEQASKWYWACGLLSLKIAILSSTYSNVSLFLIIWQNLQIGRAFKLSRVSNSSTYFSLTYHLTNLQRIRKEKPCMKGLNLFCTQWESLKSGSILTNIS